jgi:hypothetical protein
MDRITEYTFLSLYSIQAFYGQSVIFRGELWTYVTGDVTHTPRTNVADVV